MDEDDDDSPGDKTHLFVILLVAVIIITILVIIGMIGLKLLMSLEWFDCFYHSTTYLSSIGDPSLPQTKSQKTFVALFSIIGGSILIATAAGLVAQVFDRYFNL